MPNIFATFLLVRSVIAYTHAASAVASHPLPQAARQWLARIKKVGEKQFVVHYEKDGEKLTMECGMVLFGTGRKPNTDRLNLDVRPAHVAVVSRAMRTAAQILGLESRLCYFER